MLLDLAVGLVKLCAPRLINLIPGQENACPVEIWCCSLSGMVFRRRGLRKFRKPIAHKKVVDKHF